MELSKNGSGPDIDQTTSDRLADLEQIIDKGKAAFIEVGEALAEIRDNQLYKEKCSTFEAYLDERWQISRAQGYRLIAAAKVAEMSPIGDKPDNEHQARKIISEARRGKRAQHSLANAPKLAESESQPLPATNGANGSFVRIPAMPAVEDLDLETEFTAITKRFDLWISEFAQDDYLDLFNRLIEQLNDLIAEARPETVSDDDGSQFEDAETEEPELAEVGE
jgi:hypothetical protein